MVYDLILVLYHTQLTTHLNFIEEMQMGGANTMVYYACMGVVP